MKQHYREKPRLTMEEMAIYYKEISNISQSELRTILITNGVNGHYLRDNPVPNAHVALQMTLPNQQNITHDIIQLAMKKGDEKIKRMADWSFEPTSNSPTDWARVTSEMRDYVGKFKRSSNLWIVRFANKGAANKHGIMFFKEAEFLSVLSKIAPQGEYSLYGWKGKGNWCHLHLKLFHTVSPKGESFFIYKPTLKEFNEMKTGNYVQKQLNEKEFLKETPESLGF